MTIFVTLFSLAAVFALLARWTAIRRSDMSRDDASEKRSQLLAKPTFSKSARGTIKIIVLSSYAKDKARQARQQREDDYTVEAEQHRLAIEARQRESEGRGYALAIAWYQREILGVIKAFKDCETLRKTPTPRSPLIRSASKEEILWANGHEGERMLDDFLQERLDNDWTLIAGCRNHKGEIDRILVGPMGVFAFEVKNHVGVIYCQGDRWWRDRFDHGDRILESGAPIKDRGGRSPSQQLNESVDQLQIQHGQLLPGGRIIRIVLFTNAEARLGEMNGLTVDVVSTLASLDLVQVLGISTTRLSPGQCESVCNSIVATHRETRSGSCLLRFPTQNMI